MLILTNISVNTRYLLFHNLKDLKQYRISFLSSNYLFTYLKNTHIFSNNQGEKLKNHKLMRFFNNKRFYVTYSSLKAQAQPGHFRFRQKILDN